MAMVFIDEFFDVNDGLCTTGQLLSMMNRKTLARHVKTGAVVRVWRGVYALGEPDLMVRLAALDLLTGKRIVACMASAAALYGFDVDDARNVHILDPGVRMRPVPKLVVHQRVGAPLRRVDGRLATAPAWTAVEVARSQRRARGLATLDSVLHVNACTRGDLELALAQQKGRRGIVKVRQLVGLADGRAESPMESEARLVMFDYGLPPPELQYEIQGRYGECWRVDFAWPEFRVAAEYEGVDWHSGRAEMLRDKTRFAGVQDCGWIVVPIVVDDVRRYPQRLAARIDGHMRRTQWAS